MKEQLISFQTAKLAKEKGFDLFVCHRYVDVSLYDGSRKRGKKYDLETYILESEGQDMGDFLDFKDYNRGNLNLCYSAPTQSLLQRWLRINHSICVEPTLNFTSEEYPMHYNCGVMYNICSISDFQWLGCECSYTFYKTYEEALEAGLIEALKLI